VNVGPDALEQLLARDGARSLLDEVAEELKRPWSQLDHLAGGAELEAIEVQQEPGEPVLIGGGDTRHAPMIPRAAPRGERGSSRGLRSAMGFGRPGRRNHDGTLMFLSAGSG
jgi:hypothetical protein